MKFNLALPGQSLYPGNETLWSKDITGGQMRTIARPADQLRFDYQRVGKYIVMHERWVPTMGPRWLDCIALTALGVTVTDVDALLGWGEFGEARGIQAVGQTGL
jgi:hypothetical protein